MSVADGDWYVVVREYVDSARSSLRRLRFITSGRIFERAMMELYRSVSGLSKFLAFIGGPYFVTEIRRILTNFRRDWEGYQMHVIPFGDLSSTVNILIAEVETSMDVARCLPSKFQG